MMHKFSQIGNISELITVDHLGAFGLVRFGLIWFDLVWFGLVYLHLEGRREVGELSWTEERGGGEGETPLN